MGWGPICSLNPRRETKRGNAIAMHYLNLETARFHSREYVSSSRQCQGIWTHLLTYCAEQENGGRIKDCASWTGREWAAAQVTPAEVKKQCALWKWEGNDLIV